MRFQAGHRKVGGRKRGTPNKATLTLKDFARQFLESDEYRRKLKTRILSGKSPKIEELLHYYAYGKPREDAEDSRQNGTWVSDADMKLAADQFKEKLERVLARQRELASDGSGMTARGRTSGSIGASRND